MPDSSTSRVDLSISIVVNNYNYARFLPQALDSALHQMRKEDELIVVDDGSTDESMAILQHYKNTYGITVISQENEGQMRAVRSGISAAQNDILVLLDSDDCLLNGYLRRLREIYAKHTDVSFVSCDAKVDGPSRQQVKSIRKMMDAMELVPGRTGSTKWATRLFNEFVGVPFSGNSFRRALAATVMELPQDADITTTLPPVLSNLLRISKQVQSGLGLSADGVIVRLASIAGVQKYYDDQPGFLYRVHESNKYANTPVLGRWYIRHRRKCEFIALIDRHLGVTALPSATELCEEILGRSTSKKLRRRTLIRYRYCKAIFFSRGTATEKLLAWRAALGYPASKPVSQNR